MVTLLAAGCSPGNADGEEDAVVSTPTTTTTTTEPPLDIAEHATGLLVGIEAEGQFLPAEEAGTTEVGRGTGLILAETGLVLTSATSVVGADRINVYIPGEEFPLVGTLEAAAECANLALVQVDYSFATTAELDEPGPPAALAEAKRTAVTYSLVESSASGDAYRVSGVVGASTGSVLFDEDGVVAGIVTGFDQAGLPLALRSDVASVLVRQMRQRDVVQQLGFIGVPDSEGHVVVAAVAPTGPGAALGLDVGDVIRKVGETDLVSGLGQLCDLVDRTDAVLEVIHEDRRHLGPFPSGPLTLASARETAQIRKAVVEVIRPDGGTGSGFFITPDGLLVTNYHVAGDTVEVELRYDGSAETFSARVLGGSACADVAVVQASGSSFEYLEWSPEPPRLEETIRVVGFPNGTDTISFQDGTVTKEISDDIDFGGFLTNFESSAKTDRGSSGSPVVNELGEVLGLNYAVETGSLDVVLNPRHLVGLEVRDEVEEILAGTVIDPGFQAIWAYDEYIDGLLGYTVVVGTVNPNSPAGELGLEFGDEIVVFDDVYPQPDLSGARRICDAVSENATQRSMPVTVWRWFDRTLWDGEFYGDELTVRPDPYYLATTDATLGAVIPGRWTSTDDIDVAGEDWVGYWAAPSLDDYFGRFGQAPGMRFMYSLEKAQTHTSAEHLEGLNYSSEATGPIESFNSYGLIGHYQYYDFNGRSAVEYAFTLDSATDGPLFMLFIADADYRLDATAQGIMSTLFYDGPFPTAEDE